MPMLQSPGVRLRGLSSVAERETTEIASSGPEIRAKWRRMWDRRDNQEVGLEAAILERVRNSSLVKWSCADDVAGLKHGAEAAGSFIWRDVRGRPRTSRPRDR